MCKLVMIEKENEEVLYSKQFSDRQKAENLKEVFDKFLDHSKIETKILEKKKGAKKNEKESS